MPRAWNLDPNCCSSVCANWRKARVTSRTVAALSPAKLVRAGVDSSEALSNESRNNKALRYVPSLAANALCWRRKCCRCTRSFISGSAGFRRAALLLCAAKMAISSSSCTSSANVSFSIWEMSLNHPSVNWLSKLGAGSCQRPQCRRPRTLHVSVREERRSAAQDVSIKWNDSSKALCSLELVDEHSNRRLWAQSKSMGAWPILASPFSALVSCITVCISSTTP